MISGLYPAFLNTPVDSFGYGTGLTASLLFKLILRNPVLLFSHSLLPIQYPAERGTGDDKHDAKLGVGHFFHQAVEDNVWRLGCVWDVGHIIFCIRGS